RGAQAIDISRRQPEGDGAIVEALDDGALIHPGLQHADHVIDADCLGACGGHGTGGENHRECQKRRDQDSTPHASPRWLYDTPAGGGGPPILRVATADPETARDPGCNSDFWGFPRSARPPCSTS